MMTTSRLRWRTSTGDAISRAEPRHLAMDSPEGATASRSTASASGWTGPAMRPSRRSSVSLSPRADARTDADGPRTIIVCVCRCRVVVLSFALCGRVVHVVRSLSLQLCCQLSRRCLVLPKDADAAPPSPEHDFMHPVLDTQQTQNTQRTQRTQYVVKVLLDGVCVSLSL